LQEILLKEVNIFRSPFSNTGILRYLATLFPDTQFKKNQTKWRDFKDCFAPFLALLIHQDLIQAIKKN